jgi:hypothetical protein
MYRHSIVIAGECQISIDVSAKMGLEARLISVRRSIRELLHCSGQGTMDGCTVRYLSPVGVSPAPDRTIR